MFRYVPIKILLPMFTFIPLLILHLLLLYSKLGICLSLCYEHVTEDMKLFGNDLCVASMPMTEAEHYDIQHKN
jgi:hypothetical protein